MGASKEGQIVSPGPSEQLLQRAAAIVDANFPDIADNPSTQKWFKGFLARTVVEDDMYDAIEVVVRSRLNGNSSEVFGMSTVRKDLLPGQPVSIAPVDLSPAIQKPH